MAASDRTTGLARFRQGVALIWLICICAIIGQAFPGLWFEPGTSPVPERLTIPPFATVFAASIVFPLPVIDENGDTGPRLITRRQPGAVTGESGRLTTGWFDAWDAADQLPRLVELNINQNIEGRAVERQIVVDLPLAR